MILDHPGQKRKLCLAAHHGNCTPPRISPSCPYLGQEYQRWCCHRKTDQPRSALWTVGPAPHLTCRFYADICTGGSSRSLQCRCPFSIFTRHTNGCISASGYSLGKVHDKAFSGFRKSSPHYLSSFRISHSRN